jgi:hypothetical protein
MKAQDAFYQLIYDFSVKRQHNHSHSKDENTIAQVGSAINQADDSKTEATKTNTNTLAGKATAKTGLGGLVGKEKVEEGRVGWRVYLDYARAV